MKAVVTVTTCANQVNNSVPPSIPPSALCWHFTKEKHSEKLISTHTSMTFPPKAQIKMRDQGRRDPEGKEGCMYIWGWEHCVQLGLRITDLEDNSNLFLSFL